MILLLLAAFVYMYLQFLAALAIIPFAVWILTVLLGKSPEKKVLWGKKTAFYGYAKSEIKWSANKLIFLSTVSLHFHLIKPWKTEPIPCTRHPVLRVS